MKTKLYLILLSSLFLFIFFIFSSFRLNDGSLRLIFCDVGQGDAVYIRTPGGADVMIDAGPDDSVLDCLSSHMPFWDRNFEAVFLTHPDADHMTGYIEIIQRYGIDSFYVSDIESDTLLFKELMELIKKKGINKKIIYKGDNLKFSDGLVISTLWPGKQFVKSEKRKVTKEKNVFSLVQFLEYKDKQVLLTGDIDSEFLNVIVENLKDIDILKLPHHGARSGVDKFTFSKQKPELTIISVGKNNRYKHPSNEVLSILKDYNISFKRTDKDGEVEIVIFSDGSGFEVK